MTPEAMAKIRKWIKEKKVAEVPTPLITQEPSPTQEPTPTKPIQTDTSLQQDIILGNCLDVLKSFPDNTFTAVVTDPPYFLNFMGKKWDAAPEDIGSEISDQMKYFQDWSEAWAKEVLRVLKPGGHLLSFGGPRTYHRMVCGIEDAGFQIRDKLAYICECQDSLSWIYGQGFPKSLNIGKSMEKTNRGCPHGKTDPLSPMHGKWKGGQSFGGGKSMWTEENLNDPSPDDRELSGEAKQWEGYGTALKPAHEPIAVFGKDAPPLNPESPFKYESKASTKERNQGCDHLFWLTNDTGQTYPISKEHYDTLTQENETRKNEPNFQKHQLSTGNIHPTVKPLDLMRYLVKMVKMPGHNLILDPFAGSGTTAVACELEECGYVAIEQDPNAITIIKARVAYVRNLGKPKS